MSRLFYHVMQDNLGNLLFDVTGTVRLAGTGTAATIYGDAALTVPIANPMTNHPSFGSFKCYLGAGNYDFYMAKAGYTFETLTGLQGWGTMALQNANLVAITGGSAAFSTTLQVAGNVGIHTAPQGGIGLTVSHNKAAAEHGMMIGPTGANTGGYAVIFNNSSGTIVGAINTDATTTTYSTTSDARLKTAVQNLVGELAVIRALRPVRFRWLADDSDGVGFLAQEVAEHVQGVITGEPDAMDAEGAVVPQMIDMSKLVPWLVGALQTLAGQVETLTERVTELEEGLGV